MLSHNEMIDAYSDGVVLLRTSLENIDDSQLDARPIDGKWSIREVVCHLADAEIIYADRMKRVLAEVEPLFFEANPELFRHALNAENRSIEVELDVITVVRQHMSHILRSADTEDLQRRGRHSRDGSMTLETLLQRITDHIPHHVGFILEKIVAMEN